MSTFRSSRIARALTALLLGTAALPSFAIVMNPSPPGATYYFGTPTGSTPYPPSLPQADSSGSYSRNSNSTVATLALTPSPNLTLQVNAADYVGAAVVYHYEIAGTFDASGVVNGTMTTSMSVGGQGFYTVIAGITGSEIAPSPDNAVCLSTTTTYCIDNGYGASLQNHVFNVAFKPSGDIELAAAAQVVFGSAHATVDPVITLPSGYTLTLSPGAGNVAPVPEPATWLMFVAGAGFIGARARRRRV